MPTFGTFTDSRDGHVYTTVLMPDGQWWFAENAAWDGAGVDYNDDPANRTTYGRLYTFSETAAACPPGAFVPTSADWDALIAASGDPSDLGYRLKSTSLWTAGGNGTNALGFDARPSGVKTGAGYDLLGIQCGWFYSSTRVIFLQNSSALFETWGTSSEMHYAARYIVPTPPPDSPAFYGNPFEGFDAGTVSVEIDRKLTLVDTLGGRPVLIPYAPADKDEWLITAEFWTSAAQARKIEQRTPPRGAPAYPGISVPARSGENTFAGLAPAATNGSADTYIDPIMLQPLEVLGQKDVRVDLYGYRASFSLSCSSVSNPYSSNPATPPTTTPPAWLPNKWRVHSIEDGSNERRVIGPGGKWTGSGNPIVVNAIRPLSIQCDHLTTEQANELVAFFRGIRGNLFSLGFYPGPVGAHVPANPDFVATKLTCKRDAGLLWSATLEVVAA